MNCLNSKAHRLEHCRRSHFPINGGPTRGQALCCPDLSSKGMPSWVALFKALGGGSINTYLDGQKIAYDMDDLDQASRTALYAALSRLLYTHRHGARALVTQLILSLADMSVLMAETLDPVGSMMDEYAAEPDMVCALLEFLTELPAEIHDGRLIGNADEVLCFTMDNLF